MTTSVKHWFKSLRFKGEEGKHHAIPLSRKFIAWFIRESVGSTRSGNYMFQTVDRLTGYVSAYALMRTEMYHSKPLTNIVKVQYNTDITSSFLPFFFISQQSFK